MGTRSVLVPLSDTKQNLGRAPIPGPHAVPEADAIVGQVVEVGRFLHRVVALALEVQRDAPAGSSVIFPCGLRITKHTHAAASLISENQAAVAEEMDIAVEIPAHVWAGFRGS